MGRFNITSRISYGTLDNLILKTTSFVNQDVTTTANVNFNSGTIANDLTVNGNLLVRGGTTFLETHHLIVEDNLITVNS